MDEIETPKSGVDRRSLLKKGAVAGAVAWTAPAIISSPAFASTGTFGCSAPVLGSTFASESYTITLSTATLRACLGCPTEALTIEGVSNVDAAIPGTTNTAVITVSGNPETFAVRFKCTGGCMILVYRRTGSGGPAVWAQLGSEGC